MEQTLTRHHLQVPGSLRGQLSDFRKRLWTIRMIEAVCAAIAGVLLSFLVTYVLERMFDTPAALRWVILLVATLGCLLVPLTSHRWIWRYRRMEPLARLLSKELPSIGDQLLGVIELAGNATEQARSRVLCEAAIEDVARKAAACDFRLAVPHPRHRRGIAMTAILLLPTAIVMSAYPAAAFNSWLRFLAPWASTARYTFAVIEPLPAELVVAHGEPFTLDIRLADRSASRPESGRVQIGDGESVLANLSDGKYRFELRGLLADQSLTASIGDVQAELQVHPVPRPELTGITAQFHLPEYLGRNEPQAKDARGGAVSLVKGSRAKYQATASRALSSARVGGHSAPLRGSDFSSSESPVVESARVEFTWRDQFGLAGKEPFLLQVTCRDDEPPSLTCDNFPRQKVVLDSELLRYQVRVHDDFGIKAVGIEWKSGEELDAKHPVAGERILGAGGHQKDELELTGTFSAQNLGIEPQLVHVRLFAEDYFPGRSRVYSPTHALYVLNAEQHAVWITEQLSKWHRVSLEVRDREMQLYEVNKRLRELSPGDLDLPDTRQQIARQASAERSNGGRLAGLVQAGEELVKQASRNPEFGVGHLEKWAEMLQILKDISANRMPSVADLLSDAAQSPQVSAGAPEKRDRVAGKVRTGSAGKNKADEEAAEKDPKTPSRQAPSIVDVESSQQPVENSGSEPAEKEAGKGSLGLPQTLLAGKEGTDEQACPIRKKLDEAIEQQQDLLAEFDKIADELNRVLASLEGSTLVKRLKAESRIQAKVAGRLGDEVSIAFGQKDPIDPPSVLIRELTEQEVKSSQTVSYIMDDMQGYFDRRHFVQFKTVLDDMRKQDILGGLRQLADDIPLENGVAIALCEYWSDTLDRWAEDLVDPVSGGT